MAGKFLESLTFESINSCATNKRNESLIKCRVAPISPKPIRRHHKVSRFLRASLSFLSSHTHTLSLLFEWTIHLGHSLGTAVIPRFFISPSVQICEPSQMGRKSSAVQRFTTVANLSLLSDSHWLRSLNFFLNL